MNIEKSISGEAEPKIKINVEHSVQTEIDRVNRTLAWLDWYKRNGYNISRIRLPHKISNILLFDEPENRFTKDEVVSAIRDEYDDAEFEKQKGLLLESWGNIEARFFGNLKKLGLPIQSDYQITLTKYGMGGSYYPPNRVSLSVGESFNEANYVLAHEIIHLTIESLIQEYKIDQWTKETIVDLTMNNFFVERQRIQRMGDNFEELKKIFDTHFPNMAEIIQIISKKITSHQ